MDVLNCNLFFLFACVFAVISVRRWYVSIIIQAANKILISQEWFLYYFFDANVPRNFSVASKAPGSGNYLRLRLLKKPIAF